MKDRTCRVKGTTYLAPVAGRSSKELERICRETLRAMFPSFRRDEVTASFYPYIGLTHTIRKKGRRWEIRISDHCSRAPRAVLEAIAVSLACKVLRRRVPREIERVYSSFRRAPEVVAALNACRLARGRKRLDGATGRYHSLQEIYEEVNTTYFKNQVALRALGWGRRKSWSRLGHFDVVHQTITISPVLDSPGVPRWVLAYLLYHEMLHSLFEIPNGLSPRRHHPPEFRRAEEAHPDCLRARKFLNEYCRARRISN